MFKSTKASYVGFKDIFGYEARLREFITAKISEVFQLWGYDKIELSVIESMDSFNERVVGGSPWPEWNQKCSFQIDIHDYVDTYNNKPISNRALLVPEGTISISRWLASQIDTGQDLQAGFPLKVYYVVNCFRNELITNLSATKTRNFTQLGTEIIGTSNHYADLETIMLVTNGLETLGVPKNHIKIRLSDIRIFNHLCKKCEIPYQEAIILKEIFDSIAESRANNDAKRLINELAKANKILSEYVTDVKTQSQWDFCLVGTKQLINDEEAMFLECSETVSDLNSIVNELGKLNVPRVIDLTVVRSHEYYTGIVFEIDVTVDDQIIVEIAGGGRYNKLISRLSKKNIEVPAVGFAFGLERICRLAKNLQKSTSLEARFWLDESPADIVLYGHRPAHQLVKLAQQLRKNHKRVDIYAGDKPTSQEINIYAVKKNAKLIHIRNEKQTTKGDTI